MKPHPPILRGIVIGARKGGKSFRAIALAYRLPIGTVKVWCHRGGKNETPLYVGEATKHETGKWMQSLHHDTAHFITDGRAACEGAQNGAKIVGGSMWHPHDGCVKKCLRCLKRAENE